MTSHTIVVVAAAAHLFFRVLYVVGVGIALRLEESRRYFTAERGIEDGFERFRSLASPVMALDAISFVAMAWLTRDTLRVAIPMITRISVGAVLVIVAITVKIWARETLGEKAYYWHNFFAPEEWEAPAAPGPYRWFRNPMYTVGYLHAWGFALALGSRTGLLFALFDQAAILVFHYAVEEPHFRRLQRDSGA